MSDKLHELIVEGMPYLTQYLQENGVEIGKNGLFSCIHPNHDDSNPSCGIVPKSNGEIFHCLGCQCSGNIYTAAHYLENKPLYGIGFVKDNLEYILDKFGIDHESVELTEAQVRSFKYQKVYDAAVSVMFQKNELNSYVHIIFDHARTRGWSEDTCLELQVGTIIDYQKFIKNIGLVTSLSSSEIEEMGITDKLFGPTKLTFTIKDHKGKIIGFVCRNMDWKKGSDLPKYYNTCEFKNPFYQKDRLLYGLNIAKKFTGLPLDIFEGYGSYVTAYQAGLRTCVAMGGTAFTNEHAQLLFDLGFRTINYVMDVDETGKNLSKVYIERFSGFQGLKVGIKTLPIKPEDLKIEGQNDADFFLKTYGIDEYRKIRTIGAFEHSLNKQAGLLKGSDEAIAFAKQTIKLIMNEASSIDRGQKVNILSSVTGVPVEDLKDEIARLENSDLSSIKAKLEKKLKSTNDPDSLESLLSGSLDQLKDTGNTKVERYQISDAESIEVLTDIFTDMNSQKEGIHGWKTGYQLLDEKIDGLTRPTRGGACIGFAGEAQAGKSAAMLNIALNAVMNNDDISVLYWAIDDNRKAIAYRMVSMLSGVHIKKVRRMLPASKDEVERIVVAQRKLLKLTEDRKLIFKDDTFGRSRRKAEAWINSFQSSCNNQILFCVDSLNNISSDDGSELRAKMISNTGWLKSLCSRIPATVMATIELVKNRGDTKPNLMAISESVKVEYDFDTIAIVWNESKFKKIEECSAKWGIEGFWKPVIELDFQKNKCAAGEKGSIFFDFDPTTTLFLNPRDSIEIEPSKPVEVKIGDSSILYSSDTDIKPEKRPQITLNLPDEAKL